MSQQVPTHQRWEKEDILRVLLHAPTLPPKSEFESQFPDDLRADRDIVMAFCQRNDFSEVHEKRGFVIPYELTSDMLVMMLYCQKVPMGLQYCSMELRNNPEMVKPVVQLNGMALQHAGHTLLEDGDIIRMACKSDGRALAFCLPGPTRQALLNDMEFMMTTLKRSPQAVDVLWALAPEYLKDDHAFILKALESGLSVKEVPLRFLTPSYLGHHKAFWEKLILYEPYLYLHLDEDTMQQREDLARHAIISTQSNAVIQAKAISYFPQLIAQHADVALSILQRGNWQLTPEKLRELNPVWLDDAKVMKSLILRNGRFIDLASGRLTGQADFVKSVLNEHTVLYVLQNALDNLTGRCLLTDHPEIAATAITLCSHLWAVKLLIPKTAWWRKEVYVPWLQRGGTAEYICVEHNRENPELALAIAKYNCREFWRVGKGLRSNRAFILQAIQENGMVIADVEQSLRRDLGLAVAAIVKIGYSRDDLLRLHYNMSLNLRGLYQLLLGKVGLMVLTKGILQNLPEGEEHHRIPPNDRCYLHLLNAGGEDITEGLLQHIAKYVGVVVGPAHPLTAHMEEAYHILSNFYQTMKSAQEDQWPIQLPSSNRQRITGPISNNKRVVQNRGLRSGADKGSELRTRRPFGMFTYSKQTGH